MAPRLPGQSFVLGWCPSLHGQVIQRALYVGDTLGVLRVVLVWPLLSTGLSKTLQAAASSTPAEHYWAVLY